MTGEARSTSGKTSHSKSFDDWCVGISSEYSSSLPLRVASPPVKDCPKMLFFSVIVNFVPDA